MKDILFSILFSHTLVNLDIQHNNELEVNLEQSS
jgi:hypothetical protein